MKKTMLVLIIVAVTAMSALALTACQVQNSDENGAKTCAELGHDWGEWAVKVAATCVESGERVRVCRRCEVEDVGKIAATGKHNFEFVEVSKAATCTEKGDQIYKCSVCGKQETRKIDEIGHAFGELHVAVAPTCATDGSMAYKQCQNCKQYFTEQGEFLTDDADELVIASTGVHSWDLTNNVSWIWADDYAQFLTDGVKVEVHCSVCTATETHVATVSNDVQQSVEPTHVEQGTCVFEATVTVDGTTLTDTHTYTDVPSLPDGKPQADYALVGDFDGGGDNSARLTWIRSEQLFQIEQAFAATQRWKIQAIGNPSDEFDGNDVMSVAYADGLTEPPTALFTVADDGSVVANYACTLVITLNYSARAIHVFVREVEIPTVGKECYLLRVSSENSTYDPNDKFEKQSDGTYTFTVEFDSAFSQFKLVYGGVEIGFEAFSELRQNGHEDVGLVHFDGNFMTTCACRILITYDPDANSIIIDVLDFTT